MNYNYKSGVALQAGAGTAGCMVGRTRAIRVGLDAGMMMVSVRTAAASQAISLAEALGPKAISFSRVDGRNLMMTHAHAQHPLQPEAALQAYY